VVASERLMEGKHKMFKLREMSRLMARCYQWSFLNANKIRCDMAYEELKGCELYGLGDTVDDISSDDDELANTDRLRH